MPDDRNILWCLPYQSSSSDDPPRYGRRSKLSGLIVEGGLFEKAKLLARARVTGLQAGGSACNLRTLDDGKVERVL